MERIYWALVHKETEKDDTFGIMFPDFPGCVSAGKEMVEVYKNAQEALEFHLEGLIEDDDDIPAPSDYDDLQDEITGEEYMESLIPVRVEVPDRRVKRVNVTLPEFVLSRMEQYGKVHGETRSGLIAKAADEYMTRHA